MQRYRKPDKRRLLVVAIIFVIALYVAVSILQEPFSARQIALLVALGAAVAVTLIAVKKYLPPQE